MPEIRRSVVPWLLALLLLLEWTVGMVRGGDSSEASQRRTILVLDISGSMEEEGKDRKSVV